MYADAVHRRNRGVRCSQDDAVRPRFVGVFSSDATIFSLERLRVKPHFFSQSRSRMIKITLGVHDTSS
jgi:hypothetical protein